MEQLQREDIHSLAKHSQMSGEQVEQALQQHVYQDKKSWADFLRISLLVLGIGFLTSGLVFFFAYNWADLPKFGKLAIVQGLLLLVSLLAIYPKFSTLTRQLLLSSAAVLVGLIFAVFGQIYQTGADAYDFFLAWTLFIVLWTVISDFPPLWLFFIGLLNITFYLYVDQVARHWGETLVFSILFVLNLLPLVFAELWNIQQRKQVIPQYFINMMAIAALAFATIGNLHFILTGHTEAPLLPGISLAIYALGIGFGLRTKSIFYLASISLSMIIITTGLIVENIQSEFGILLASIFVLFSISAVIYYILQLLKHPGYETRK